VFGLNPLQQNCQENSFQIAPYSQKDNECRHTASTHSRTSSQKPEQQPELLSENRYKTEKNTDTLNIHIHCIDKPNVHTYTT